MRQLLYEGWGIFSGSVYANDLGINVRLIAASGHVEFKRVLNPDGTILILNPNNLVCKSHELPRGNEKSLVLIRDGRAACVSLWKFLKKDPSLEFVPTLAEIISGQSHFGLWSSHVMAWHDAENVLATIKYEDMVDNPSGVVEKLVNLFGPAQGDPFVPFRNRNEMVELDGRWVAKRENWQEAWSAELEELFWFHNREAMDSFYPNAELFTVPI